MTTTVCNGCGACCDPVMLPYTQSEAARMNLSPEEKHWILHDLTPMKRPLAKAKFPEVFENRVVGLKEDEIMPFFYSCRHFDPEARRCTDYENRPEVCRTYPYVDGVIFPNSCLPPTCAFRADIGLPVIPMPVKVRVS